MKFDDLALVIIDEEQHFGAAEKAKLYKDAQETIWNDAPWIFLGVDRNLSAQSKKLAGLHMIPDGGLLIEEAALTA